MIMNLSISSKDSHLNLELRDMEKFTYILRVKIYGDHSKKLLTILHEAYIKKIL